MNNFFDVSNFRKTLNIFNIIANVVFSIMVIIGFGLIKDDELNAGLGIIISAILFWIMKFFLMGICQSLAQIAINTSNFTNPETLTNNQNNNSSPMGTSQRNVYQARPLDVQFIELYEQHNDNTFITDTMHQAYQKLKSGKSIRSHVIEAQINKINIGLMSEDNNAK